MFHHFSRYTQLRTAGSHPQSTRTTAIALICSFAAAAAVLVVSVSTGVSSPFAVIFWHFSKTGHDFYAPKATALNGSYIGGVNLERGVDKFLGIPYARPPVEDLRFRPPQPLEGSWKYPRPAVSYSKSCWEHRVQDGRGLQSQAYAEDCLYLNVIRPSQQARSGPLPVLVMFHGGAFRFGSPAEPRFDLDPLIESSMYIKKPIIAVSVNYRLLGWGLLASRELMNGQNTNLALKDQRLALHWIKENISGFGGIRLASWTVSETNTTKGDPHKVTLWGGSAGASSVGLHILANGGRNDSLFRAGIMASGSPIPYAPMRDLSYHQNLFDAVKSSVGCANHSDTLSCMRQAPFFRINEAFFALSNADWAPMVDGHFVQELPSSQLSRGAFVGVPIITGTNTDEGIGFCPKPVENSADFVDCIQGPVPPVLQNMSLSDDLVHRIAAVYPEDDPCLGTPSGQSCLKPMNNLGSQFYRCAAYTGDFLMHANRRLVCQTWGAHGIPAYSYRFNALPHDGLISTEGVVHASERSFALNLKDLVKVYLYAGFHEGSAALKKAHQHETRYLELASLISSSWISFVHDLDPNTHRVNGSRFPTWQKYNEHNGQNLVFDANVTSFLELDTFRAEAIELLNSLNKEFNR